MAKPSTGNGSALLIRCLLAKKRYQEYYRQIIRHSREGRYTMRLKSLHKIPAALSIALLAAGLIFMTGVRAQKSDGAAQMLKGEGSFNDWANERPGNRYIIKASDLPKP